MSTEVFDPSSMEITQVALPSALRRQFKSKTISAKTIVAAWKLTMRGQLLLVENDIRVLLNLHIDEAMKTLRISTKQPAPRLPIFGELQTTLSDRKPKQRKSASPSEASQMKRISIISTFDIRIWSSCSAFDLRRNLCDSGQEKEFLRAIRQFFPTMLSYPNVTLQSFIDLDELGAAIPKGLREFSRNSRVDVLLCTHDEDPVAGFELDSAWHDIKANANRDDMKQTVFHLAGIPLIRIRPANPSTVRAEDFFDLLNTEEAVATLRPRHMRPRRSHEGLVPVTSDVIRSWT